MRNWFLILQLSIKVFLYSLCDMMAMLFSHPSPLPLSALSYLQATVKASLSTRASFPPETLLWDTSAFLFLQALALLSVSLSVINITVRLNLLLLLLHLFVCCSSNKRDMNKCKQRWGFFACGGRCAVTLLSWFQRQENGGQLACNHGLEVGRIRSFHYPVGQHQSSALDEDATGSPGLMVLPCLRKMQQKCPLGHIKCPPSGQNMANGPLGQDFKDRPLIITCLWNRWLENLLFPMCFNTELQ